MYLFSQISDIILKNQKGNIDEADINNRSAIFYCVDHSDLRCINLLLEAKANLKLKDIDGYTCLHLAVINNNQIVVDLLCNHFSDINTGDNEMHTIIHWCVVCGHMELLEHLLGKPNINPNIGDINGAYPIHYAAQMCGEKEAWDDSLNIGPKRSIEKNIFTLKFF